MFRTLDQLDPRGKRVVLRADLNVPAKDGKVTDTTRIDRSAATIRELAEKGGKVIILTHFGRPKGREEKYSQKLLLEPLAKAVGRSVAWADDVIGIDAVEAVKAMKDGDILLMENVRFHPEEEKNDANFARALADLGDVYVNDAFSTAHRAHASTEAIARLIPAYAGRLMQAELEALGKALEQPEKPVAAVVGGAKVSTKLDLLGNLVAKVDYLIIGGGMANTFLFAQGVQVGKSAGRCGGGLGIRRECSEQGGAGDCGAGRYDDPRRRPGQRRIHHRSSGRLQDPGLERPAGRVRDRSLRRGDQCRGSGGGSAHQGRQAADRGRRWRYRGRAGQGWGGGGVLLRLDRRRRVPGMARRQGTAGCRRSAGQGPWWLRLRRQALSRSGRETERTPVLRGRRFFMADFCELLPTLSHQGRRSFLWGLSPLSPRGRGLG